MVDPLGILLVKSDSKGYRLLFRYPFHAAGEAKPTSSDRLNPYAVVTPVTEDFLYNSTPQDNAKYEKGDLFGLSAEVLATLFAVNPSLAEKRFEVKVNEIRFVGHPTLIQQCSYDQRSKWENPPNVLVHVVFVLNASVDYTVVKCYHDLSKKLGVAIKHEERRCGYFFKEMKIMMGALEEEARSKNLERHFHMLFEKCILARDLKRVYDSLLSNGAIYFKFNKWLHISFCLTQKVHSVYAPNFIVTPNDINKCLRHLKPYHGLLLLLDTSAFLKMLPQDASPAAARFLKYYSPIKNIQTMAADSDLTIAQVYDLIGHFLYWGKAIVIYPLCASNVYVVTPGKGAGITSDLAIEFKEKFPGEDLYDIMSEFALPSTLMQNTNPLTHPEEQVELVKMVAWLLQHRLLAQLHTYIYFMPTKKGLVDRREFGDESDNHYRSGYFKDGRSASDCETRTMCSLRAGSDEDLSDASEDAAEMPMAPLQTEMHRWLNSSVSDEGDSDEDGYVIDDDFISSFAEDEREALLRIPTSSTPDDFHFLIHLLKKGYLRGDNHLEDIMYMENISRSNLVQLIEKFSDILITCEYEDPAVAVFYQQS